MAKRILIPLDGHESSEVIIPIASAIAHAHGSSVRLLRVYPVPERVVGTHGRVVAYVDQEMARLTAQGLEELHRVEAELDGIPIDSVVRFGEPTDEILLEADAYSADLIALTTAKHGRLASAVAPGTAQEVARRSPAATLLLRPGLLP